MNSNRLFKTATLAVVPLILLSIYLVFFYAPQEKVLGFSQKIFYFHVPIGWNALLAFTIVFFASVGYLRTQDKKYEIMGKAAAEVGAIFVTLSLITGMIWNKPAWGVWWTWDVRLTTTLVLWLLYVGYLMLGSAVEEEGKRARFLAVYGVVAFVDVPLVFFSIRIWNSLHPVVFDSTGSHLDGRMLMAFFVALFTFTVFFVAVLMARIRLGNVQEELIKIKEGV